MLAVDRPDPLHVLDLAQIGRRERPDPVPDLVGDREPAELHEARPVLDRMIAATGRDPAWQTKGDTR